MNIVKGIDKSDSFFCFTHPTTLPSKAKPSSDSKNSFYFYVYSQEILCPEHTKYKFAKKTDAICLFIVAF
jgi:hypothetical protein